MPILKQETSLFPENVLSLAELDLSGEQPVADESPIWWSMYTRSRQEKQLMRKLVALGTPFCCPTIERRHRSPSGRLRKTYEPLFSNYVFVFGDAAARHSALTTNCVSQCQPVADGLRLTHDLAQIQQLIDTGEPLSPEARLEPGDRVRIKTGIFAGFEGTILHRRNETRLLVAVSFMQQGASVLLQDCQMEFLGPVPQLANTKNNGSIDAVYHHKSGCYEVRLGSRSED